MGKVFRVKYGRKQHWVNQVTIKNRYKRIAKRSAFITGYSLWVNSAFLLSISTGPFSENYKRFYFQDIKSLVLQKTETWKIWNWFLGLTGVCFALIMVLAGGKGIIFTGLVTGVVLVALVANNMRGPSCICYIETAVQKEKLNSLNRIKKAQSAMDAVRPLILQVQRKKIPTGALNSNL